MRTVRLFVTRTVPRRGPSPASSPAAARRLFSAAMADGPDAKASGLLEDLFRILDKKERGFVSRVELGHILEAMLADPRCQIEIPEELKLGGAKDSRVSFAQLKEYLQEWTHSQLEDLKWFAESVVRVEKELRFVWQKSVRTWREKVMKLYTRNLHRYLLKAQPDRVARWLLLRTYAEQACMAVL